MYWFRGLGPGKGFAKRAVLFEGGAESDQMMATANTADLDGDGDLDLLVGDVKGRAWLVKNTGTKKVPKFVEREPLLADKEQVRVNQKSDVIAVDWDSDGKLDLLVGDEIGDVSFFGGKGDGTFERGVSLFTKQPVDATLGYDKAKKRLEPQRAIPGYRLRLAVADWNDDGKLDLLVGNCETKPKPGGDEEDSITIGNVYVFLRE